jgi:hypothetical protein
MKKYTVEICNEKVEINRTRATAIKAHCMDCSAGQIGEVKLCPCTLCPLYVYRGYINLRKKPTSAAEKRRLKKMGFKKQAIS